jgi:AbrB family looped-hinge helix DNA binding protein
MHGQFAGKVTSKGQTTIPAEVRASLAVGPGDHVSFELCEDGTVVMRKVPPLSSLAGLFKTEVKLTDSDLEQAINESRAAMASGDNWP